MLLEFTATNYKSFKDKLVFSMMPAPKQKGLDYSILHEKIGRFQYKGLSTAVIYGPNASGKTNIIGAMDTFKHIVLRGNIRNYKGETDNTAANILEFIPNNTSEESIPIDFSIKFIEQGLLIEYALSLDIGTFLNMGHYRRIVKESLKINNKPVFDRENKLEIHTLNFINAYLINEFEQNSEGIIAIAKSNLNDEELFLMNGFKNMFSSKITNIIWNWFNNKFIVVYRADTVELVPDWSNTENDAIYVEENINEAAKLFGINSNALAYLIDGNNREAELCSVFEKLGNDEATIPIPAKLFESYGTIRFINMFPLLLGTLSNGGILIVDEFDASIHPMALINIINIFHNDEINVNHAQLVFNTHNPIFLNANLFRRDEIKFVERDEDTHCSTHYSLSDFGTTGSGGVRKNEDYMRNYFINRYGAINDIDFTPIFERFLKGEDEVS